MSFFSASEKEALLNLLDTNLKRGVFCLTTKCDNKLFDWSEIQFNLTREMLILIVMILMTKTMMIF